LERNILEDLKAEALQYATVGEFLVDLKREFSGGDNETIKEGRQRKQNNREVCAEV